MRIVDREEDFVGGHSHIKCQSVAELRPGKASNDLTNDLAVAGETHRHMRKQGFSLRLITAKRNSATIVT